MRVHPPPLHPVHRGTFLPSHFHNLELISTHNSNNHTRTIRIVEFKIGNCHAPLPTPGGFRAIYRDEGLRGLFRGTSLALVGVGNGALQFMGYEQLKNWAFVRKRRRIASLGRAWTMEDEKLVRITFCYALCAPEAFN